MGHQIMLRGEDDPALLGRCDARCSATVCCIPAQADFDEDQHFLMANALTDDDCRFDCILLSGTSSNDIEWLRDAFSLD